MATIILNPNETSTIANDGDIVRGRQEGAEAIRIESGVTDIETNAELERIDLPAFSSGDLSFQVTDNGLAISAGGNTIVTVPSLNQNLNLRLTDGNVTLSQTGAQEFTLTNPTDSNDTATIGTESTGLTVGLGNRPDPNNFELTPQDASVKEGESITYTLTTNVAVNSATDVNFSVIPGDANAPDQGTNNTNLNDFQQGAFNPSTVTIAQGDKQAEFTLNTSNEGLTELPEEFDVQAEVNGETVTVDTTLLDGSGFQLTTGDDSFTGNSNDDVLTAGLGTLNSGDILEGLGGNDTLNARISSDIGDGDPTNGNGPTLDSVDNVNINSRGSVSNILDFDSATGLSQLTVTGPSGLNSTGLTNALTTVGISGNNTDGAFDSLVGLEFEDDQLTGNDDSLTLELDNVSDANLELGAQATTGTNTLETLNIASNGSATNSLTLDLTAAGFPDSALQAAGNNVGEFVITGDADLDITGVIGEFDEVDASGATGNISLTFPAVTDPNFNASNVTGVDRFSFGTTGNTVQLDNLEDNVTIELTGNNPDDVTANIQDADVPNTSNTLNLVLDNAADDTAVTPGNLTSLGLETLNIESTGTSSNTNTIGTFANVTNLDTANIAGDSDLNIADTGNLGDEFAIDASNFSGDLFVSANANTGNGVALTGGSGNDTLIGADGLSDSLTGNGGNDTFGFLTETASDVDNDAVDIITGFSVSDDTLDFDTSTSANNTDPMMDDNDTTDDAQVVADATDSFSNGVVTGQLATDISDDADLDAAVATIEGDGNVADNDVGAFEFGGNTFVFQAEAANDLGNVVQLSGTTGITEVNEVSNNDAFTLV